MDKADFMVVSTFMLHFELDNTFGLRMYNFRDHKTPVIYYSNVNQQ